MAASWRKVPGSSAESLRYTISSFDWEGQRQKTKKVGVSMVGNYVGGGGHFFYNNFIGSVLEWIFRKWYKEMYEINKINIKNYKE